MDDLKLFAVTGKPVLHSQSPLIFNALFQKHGFPGTYTRLAARDAEEAVSLFRELRLAGMNVTAPFKERVLSRLDRLDPAAAAIGAANVIVKEGNRLCGYNTDHIGVVGAFKKRGVEIARKRCLVLGAGGAGRAAGYGLTNDGGLVTMVNRTYDRAARAAEALGCRADRIEHLGQLLQDSDILVSAISTNSSPIKPDWLPRHLVVFDAHYPESALAAAALRKGCVTLRGEEWLLHQAAPAYALLTGNQTGESHMESVSFSDWPSLRRKTHISFIGFMGSGKTVTGRKIAEKLGVAFEDTDSLVELAEGRTIREIFEAKGEVYFRKVESQAIAKLRNEPKAVYSCGGGCVLTAQNRNALRDNSLVIWLYAPLALSLRRISPETRPLLQGDNPEETAKKLFDSRYSFYAQTADLVVGSENLERAVDTVYEEIHQTLGR
jgi:shikimate dehydrogenase